MCITKPSNGGGSGVRCTCVIKICSFCRSIVFVKKQLVITYTQGLLEYDMYPPLSKLPRADIASHGHTMVHYKFTVTFTSVVTRKGG